MRASWIMMMALTAFALAACENSSLTDECTTADDCNGGLDGTCGWICEDLTWPIDCDGHWECNAGTCEAVCDT